MHQHRAHKRPILNYVSVNLYEFFYLYKELTEISADVVEYGAFVCALLVNALLWALPLLVRRLKELIEISAL